MGYNLDVKKMKKVGNIGNYYGGLYVQKKENKYYWIIENYDTEFDNLEEWEEISENLYNELIGNNKKHITEKELKKAAKECNLQIGIIDYLINKVRINQRKFTQSSE